MQALAHTEQSLQQLQDVSTEQQRNEAKGNERAREVSDMYWLSQKKISVFVLQSVYCEKKRLATKKVMYSNEW